LPAYLLGCPTNSAISGTHEANTACSLSNGEVKREREREREREKFVRKIRKVDKRIEQ